MEVLADPNLQENYMAKLYEASLNGCISTLNTLTHKDPLILSRVPLYPFTETPLHRASLLGHLEFCKALLHMNPAMGSEVNSEGRCPLHLASAKGHTEVVKALLVTNRHTCMVRDKDDMLPLHFAAMRGRLGAIEALISAMPESIRERIESDEITVLHLCVQYNHLEALKLLMESVRGDSQFLCAQDKEGNTLLHLAMRRRQNKTIKYLLSLPEMSPAMSALNRAGLKPLEMLESPARNFASFTSEQNLTDEAGVQRSTNMVISHEGAPSLTLNTEQQTDQSQQQQHPSSQSIAIELHPGPLLLSIPATPEEEPSTSIGISPQSLSSTDNNAQQSPSLSSVDNNAQQQQPSGSIELVHQQLLPSSNHTGPLLLSIPATPQEEPSTNIGTSQSPPLSLSSVDNNAQQQQQPSGSIELVHQQSLPAPNHTDPNSQPPPTTPEAGVSIQTQQSNPPAEPPPPPSRFERFCKKYLISQKNWMDDKQLIVAATVIATMTFQTVISPPGGVWGQDSTESSHECKTYGYCAAGTAIVGYAWSPDFLKFIFFNTTSFFSSLCVLLVIISGFPLDNKVILWILSFLMVASVTCMLFTYMWALGLTSPDHIYYRIRSLGYILICTWAFLLLLICVIQVIRFMFWRRSRHRSLRIAHSDLATQPRDTYTDGSTII